ncbi:hypothetical protein AHAS_Ahas11G0214200 [Arachis hypogaea]
MFKNKAMLAPENVHNDKPLHGYQGYENPVFGNVEHRPTKHPRGRPHKQLQKDYQDQHISRGKGRGRGRGRGISVGGIGDGAGRGRGKGSGRGRGRPRKIKLNTNTNQSEEQLQSQDHVEGLEQEQDQGFVSESKPKSEEASKPDFGYKPEPPIKSQLQAPQPQDNMAS